MFQTKKETCSITVVIAVLLLLLSVSFIGYASGNFMHYSPPSRDPVAFYIEADGSITPPINSSVEAPIQRNGNTYTLTANMSDHPLWVQRNGIVVDGAGFTLRGGGSTGVTLNCTINVTVKNLVIDGFGRGGVTIQRQSYVGMSAYSQSNPYPVSRNNVVSNCTFINNYYVGISIAASTGNTITGNTVTGSQAGISVSNYDETTGNTIAGNLVRNNTLVGINLSTAKKETVTGNNITGNGGYGIILGSGSGNTISGNRIQGNGVGILIQSAQNTIKENTIAENNGWGIRLEAGQGSNLIYRNNFINNKVSEGLQVSIPLKMGISTGASNFSVSYVPGLSNYWSSGNEGNYWSDYWTRYPNASEMGSTGFGDTPFFINENNIDNYPLMKPVGNPEVTATPTPQPTTPPSPASPSPSPQNTTTPSNPPTPEETLESSGKGLPIDQSSALLAGTLAAFAIVGSTLLARQFRRRKVLK